MRTTRAAVATLCLSLTAMAACGGDASGGDASGDITSDSAAAIAARDSQTAHINDVVASGGVVDSVFSTEEHLARFRSTTDSTDSLMYASSSMKSLVARWAVAVEKSDTLELNRMTIGRAEFAWIVYPYSPLRLPPYEAPPELLWGQILASSNSGAARIQRRFGGKNLQVSNIECTDVLIQGPNKVHDKCIATLRAKDSDEVRARLFGSVVERNGSFKFLGLSNEL